MQSDSILSLKRPSWQQVCLLCFIAYALRCSDSLATADRGLNDHRTKVRDALIPLLTETVTDSKHQEVLRRVFGPDTKFDKPILNFDNLNLASLVKYGIQNVVWETSACSHGVARSVLKPINSAEQEPLLELLGVSLLIICVLLAP
jgi:hypothetical protein